MLVTNSFLLQVFDEGGELDATNRGMAQWVLSIDTHGTADPGDDEGTHADPARNHGAYKVGDFCQDAVRFTTG